MRGRSRKKPDILGGLSDCWLAAAAAADEKVVLELVLRVVSRMVSKAVAKMWSLGFDVLQTRRAKV